MTSISFLRSNLTTAKVANHRLNSNGHTTLHLGGIRDTLCIPIQQTHWTIGHHARNIANAHAPTDVVCIFNVLPYCDLWCHLREREVLSIVAVYYCIVIDGLICVYERRRRQGECEVEKLEVKCQV